MRKYPWSDFIKAAGFAIALSPLFATLKGCTNDWNNNKNQDTTVVVDDYQKKLDIVIKNLSKNIEAKNEWADESKKILNEIYGIGEDGKPCPMLMIDFDRPSSNNDITKDTSEFMKWIYKKR